MNHPEIVKICTQLELENRADSLTYALKENPENLAPAHSYPAVGMALTHAEAPFIAVLFQKKWAKGRTLRIKFLGDVDPAVKQKIISYAKQWLEHVNLKFDFIESGESEIRISTNLNGSSWSYLGTDAKGIAQDQPTMNFGWLYPDTSEDEYSRVVLHEFGHALGAIHEHQHPSAGIPWDRTKVYAYYALQGWSQAQVDNNIFGKYGFDQLNASAYDRDSIMHYAIPEELTIGNWSIQWNTRLSQLDKAFMKKQYP